MIDDARLFITAPQIVEAIEVTAENTVRVSDWSGLAGLAVGSWVIRTAGGFRTLPAEIFHASFVPVLKPY